MCKTKEYLTKVGRQNISFLIFYFFEVTRDEIGNPQTNVNWIDKNFSKHRNNPNLENVKSTNPDKDRSNQMQQWNNWAQSEITLLKQENRD